MKVSRASILICTYNRAPLLRETLAAAMSLRRPPDCEIEFVIVDNNSTDETPRVVAEFAGRGLFPVVSVSETRQGKGFALNAGLARSTGDVIALTDDDVLPDRDWIARIVEAFRTRDVAFVFGKVLPRWSCLPPPQLLTVEAQQIWGPLALVDYGDEPMDYLPESDRQRLPIGANLAFSRATLERIGGWRSDLGKVDNTLLSGEDHEIFIRLRRFNLYAGYYDPAIMVRHYVPAQRLTRRYFRSWFFWHGKTKAHMLADLYPEIDMSRVPRVAGVPRFLIRQGAQQLFGWLGSIGRKDALSVMKEELHTCAYAGLFVECSRMHRRRLSAMRRSSESSGVGLASQPGS